MNTVATGVASLRLARLDSRQACLVDLLSPGGEWDAPVPGDGAVRAALKRAVAEFANGG